MPPEEHKPRKNMLTEADLEALRELLAEHPCRYPFTPDQASTLVSIAENVKTAQNISFKLVVTAIVLTIIGWMGKGVVQWIAAAVKGSAK